MSPIAVLVVEDEAIAAAAHAELVQRLSGFTLVGVARSCADARRILRTSPADLLLLDMHLPDGHGLDLLAQLRLEGHGCDAVAVTSVRELDVVRRAVSQGVVSYLLKPFTFAGLRAKLEQYADYRARLSASGADVVQGEIDQLLGSLRTADEGAGLPKGMSPETLALVTAHLRGAGQARSASEVAAECGLSRVTARRYLEHLEASGVLERRPRYGGAGRPEVEYRWR
ncbi:response regulator [Nocardioides marmoribigeumensis]|uniref:Transcriptional regulatory protein n=1 Tax=Nocardioides marmoribigeumensis TaxID=433649 RepID=A0ABU2BTL8_9ACTN|nr:response regulator [Nocardioides marmoribigeumensis]MDR7361962.1 response regulator of citrate/malate metabolism [Nocardioides marmoribigeumensis]